MDDRIMHNPHLEVMPSHAGPHYLVLRNTLAQNGMTVEQAVQALNDSWTQNHEARVQAWEQQVANDAAAEEAQRHMPCQDHRYTVANSKHDGDDCEFSLFFFSSLLNVLNGLRLIPAKISGDRQAEQVRDWRHRLQKVFLSNKSLPKSEVRSSLYRNRYIVWHLMRKF
jgi:hypothetical protein